MLWKLLVSFTAFFARPFHGPPVDGPAYEVTPFGPQSWKEAQIAMQALEGENGDMRFSENWPGRAGIKDERFRWPGYPGSATVPYYIDPSLNHIEHLFEKAIDQYHQKTCIRFVKRKNESDFIHIVNYGGCYSYIGKIEGTQQLSLGPGCWYVGTIVHELGHALGLFHEHQRSDRDQYLNIYANNIIQDKIHNFQKTFTFLELILEKYDYTSIMHYGNYAFSRKPGRLKSMEAKDGTPLKEPYDKPGLNDNDVQMIQKLYKC